LVHSIESHTLNCRGDYYLVVQTRLVVPGVEVVDKPLLTYEITNTVNGYHLVPFDDYTAQLAPPQRQTWVASLLST
jgi:hypothetical protein